MHGCRPHETVDHLQAGVPVSGTCGQQQAERSLGAAEGADRTAEPAERERDDVVGVRRGGRRRRPQPTPPGPSAGLRHRHDPDHRRFDEAFEVAPRQDCRGQVFEDEGETDPAAETAAERGQEDERAGGPARPVRRDRARYDAGIERVDVGLRLGLAGAREEGLVDRTTRLDLTVEFMQLDRSLALGQRPLLGGVEACGQRASRSLWPGRSRTGPNGRAGSVPH